MDPNTTDADLRLAYHEAGHCVAAIRWGQSIRYVTIKPGKRKTPQGRVMAGRMATRQSPPSQSIEQKIADFNASLMVCFAGAVCESKATGKPVN